MAARGERMEQPDARPGTPSSARAFAFTAMPVSPVVCLANGALVAAKAIAISVRRRQQRRGAHSTRA